jgi:hypothetical protein
VRALLALASTRPALFVDAAEPRLKRLLMTNASKMARLDREAVREAKAFMGETAWPTMLFGLVIAVG